MLLENEVSIFDNLQTFLVFVVELLVQGVNALRTIPNFIAESSTQVMKYQTCFPPFLWFLICFAFGAGIICKLLHWGD